MFNYIKKNSYFIIFTILIFLVFTFAMFPNSYGDPIANYGFSYAIVRGEIPYLDFNTISTPLYAYAMSIGLFIWNNFSMFLFEQAVLVSLAFYFLKETYGVKAFSLLIVIAIFWGLPLNATYNYAAFFLVVLLLYLEKKYPNNDYLIGFVLGLAVLAKHTIGGLLLLPGLFFYWKDKKKFFKRLTSLFLLGSLFIIYLLLTKSIVQFFDLCLFGLVDFSDNNGHAFNSWFFISILFFILSLIYTFRNRNDISNWYLLCCFSFVVPLFDIHHFSLYALCLGIQFLSIIRNKEQIYGYLGVLAFSLVSLAFFVGFKNEYNSAFNYKLPRFQYFYNFKASYNHTLKVYDFFDSYPDALIISTSKMQYDISRNNNIDYFNVFLYGNHGYNGTDKLISLIEKMHDKYIIVDMSDYCNDSDTSQFNKKAVKYVIDSCEKVDSMGIFEIYYKK